MNSRDLQTASNYVNNILLARGLLKNGKPIDFAQPDDGEGSDATMAKIINLVNDLVLRRDREAEHRENLASTIQNLRTTESQQTVEIERLKSKNAELARSVAVAEGQQRALKTTMSSTEATVRKLKEQLQRMKTTVQQVRAQCANDIRKRDTELQKLKSHLNERQRGKREGLGVTTININRTTERAPKFEPDINNPGYSLKQETTEFLTQLCQNLSDENDTLINLSRTTIQTLKELQGLPESASTDGDASDMGGSWSYNQGGAVNSNPTNVMDLSAEMDTVLVHLGNLLTNPSFVPLEEVEMRDEEITRLREGWERMQLRWKQAVAMMDGWHKRISDGGDSIDLDELRKGMSLDSGLGRSLALSSANGNDSYTHDNENGLKEMEDEIEEEEQFREPQAKILKPTLARPPIRALGERNGNLKSKASARKVSFYDGAMDTASDSESDGEEPVMVKAHTSEKVTRRSSRRISSQVPRPTNQKSQLSVKDKLAAVEAEAQAATEETATQDTKKRSRSKRELAPGKSKGRRRSTLTNEELEQLIGATE
ncbi:Afadin and alpha-actinin-binding-domain-containing protein [Talaromyces proteolyticus]|uniref:Afadin and alpha-actinin-binding-domain-containing protein n=1 Tax=Talaromyces proteolyticus TaxID=1131652 RepID=A0AAD4KKP7_9EURO|nr:Afadin and alpha-actinin-binding-domain-containing protein [Talaromyces proteolyticus]KAH8692378.1 Afadin and alpha-actinin-binding-domain-containing protein [Talaromyces proteolyticus]